MVKAGIIGCGGIAQNRHIPEYAANPDAEIAGYCDWNRDRAKEMAAKYGGRVYESVDELLSDPTINAVSVCVANTQHAEITIRALKAGKHVLCEKPMAVSIGECEAMVQAAEESGKMLMIGQNQRMMKEHQRARALIREGAIGKVLTFRTAFGHQGPEHWSVMKNRTWFFDKAQAAMGAVADLGVHKTDLIQFGAIGTMTASWTYYGAAEENYTVIYGTEGVLHIYDRPDYTLYIQKPDGERIYYEMEKKLRPEVLSGSGVIDEFVSALTQNRESCISGKDVMMAMKAVFAGVESSRTGQTVRVL